MVAHGVSHGNKNEETQKPRQGRQIFRPMASFPSLYTNPENGLIRAATVSGVPGAPQSVRSGARKYPQN